MYDWLPGVCRELRGSLTEIYWLLLVPYVAFLICLEFFKIPESQISAGRILKRAVISILLLYSFDECLSVLGMLADGITEKISGVENLKNLLLHLKSVYSNEEPSWIKAREWILYIISLLSYIVAYLGVFVADVLIHFVWSILYIVSPLMILMYVSEKTAGVTASLYRGLVQVLVWKVFWSILGVLLLKLALSPEVASSDNFLTAVLMNLCIGFSMLFIPLTTRSLLGNGMESAASALGALPTAAAAGAIKLYAMKYGKKAVKEPFTGLKGTREFAERRYRQLSSGVKKGRELASRAGQAAARARNAGISDSRRAQSPFDPRGPFGNGREKILRGKE